MLKRRILSLGTAFVLLALSVFTVNAENGGSVKATSISSPKGYTTVAENENFALFADMLSGRFELLIKSTGQKISSNLTKEQTDKDTIAKAKFKRNLESQVVINYRDAILKQEITIGSGTLTAGSEIKAQKAENGLDVTYNFENLGIEFTASYRIDKEGLTATVKNSSLKETQKDKFMLVSAEVLPYFGGAVNTKSGYILVPDGSGALIHYNNGKTSAEQYSQRIYGDDATQMLENAVNVEETARLPVFGMKTESSAFIAVVEKGASLTEIRANVAGFRTSYNNACGSYIFRTTDLYSLGNSSSATTHKLYQETPDKTAEYTVRYIPVSEAPYDYSAMAHTYRSYLMNKWGKEKTEVGKDLFAEIYGAVETRKTFLGIPYRAVTPLTSYEDVLDINTYLKKNGVDDLVIKYTNWDNSNVKQKVPNKLKAVRKLGGKKELNNMLSSLNKNGTDIYLNLNFTRFTYGGHGFSTRSDSAVLLSKTTALQKKFLLSTLFEDKESPWDYLLNLEGIKEATQKYYKSAQRLNATGFGLGDLGVGIYSDYDNLTSSRSITEKYFTDAARLYSKKSGILTDGGNAYMLPFTSFISSVPVNSSNFDIEDEAVPFYQLSLSGLVGMSTPPVNQSGDYHEVFLKSLESGIALGFLWFDNDPFILKNTGHNNLYGASFEGWKERSCEYYAEWLKVREATGNGIIASHRNLTDRVTETTFENGARVIVNYSNAEYKGVAPRSYSVEGGEG